MLRRSFLKTSVALDIAKKVTLGYKINQKIYHEIKYANSLMKQSNWIKNLNVM